MTITQEAHMYSFHTSKCNFGEIFFLFFFNTALNARISVAANVEYP
jgi:hypothetical protein